MKTSSGAGTRFVPRGGCEIGSTSLTKLRCSDELIAMEAAAIASALSASTLPTDEVVFGPNAPPLTPQSAGFPPLIPPVDPNAGQPGSPVEPVQ